MIFLGSGKPVVQTDFNQPLDKTQPSVTAQTKVVTKATEVFCFMDYVSILGFFWKVMQQNLPKKSSKFFNAHKLFSKMMKQNKFFCQQ